MASSPFSLIHKALHTPQFAGVLPTVLSMLLTVLADLEPRPVAKWIYLMPSMKKILYLSLYRRYWNTESSGNLPRPWNSLVEKPGFQPLSVQHQHPCLSPPLSPTHPKAAPSTQPVNEAQILFLLLLWTNSDLIWASPEPDVMAYSHFSHVLPLGDSEW